MTSHRSSSGLRGALVALGSLAILLVAASGPGSAGIAPAAAATDPARLVFLLEYLGTDYPQAVRDGVVVNAAEYGEVLRLLREVQDGVASRGGDAEALGKGLGQVRRLIEGRAKGEEVWAATRAVLPLLTRAVGGSATPRVLPNLGNGRRLYASDCAPCHGATGSGDGPSSAGMEPPPTPFRGEQLDRLSPRQAYGAITFGMEGTAMPSYATAYTEQQRWDVAFFLPTLRPDFEEKRPGGGPRPSLAELAASSNAEILARLRNSRPEAAPGEVDYFRANFVSADGVVAPFAGQDVGAQPGLAAALAVQDAFSSVAERILPRVVGVTGWARDPEWSEEKARASRGDAWVAGNADAFRHPGFRQIHSGSGLLIDGEGHVLSSDRLLRDDRGEVVSLVDVELADQSHLPASVVGTEPTIDLAVLRIADVARLPAGLPPIEFGDSDRLQVGHWVIAVGDPPGPENVFAVGVVASPPKRQCYQELLSATGLQTSLQLPASALGGPVLDILGHVVGLAVRPKREALSGAGGEAPDERVFTLPINLVLNIYEALKVAQSRRSPWLGISVLELPLLRARLGEKARAIAIPPTGVYIDDVYDPSPASRTGVKPGDFLLRLGGHDVLSVGDFQTWLYVSGIGTPVDLELVRDGAPLRLQATIEVRPESARPR